MPKKPSRPDAEIKSLARDLATHWVPADGVEPWLRRHVQRFTLMIQDEGWSWSDIAAAMSEAGIGYGTGRAWTGKLLAVKAAQARTQRRVRASKRAATALAEDLIALKDEMRGLDAARLAEKARSATWKAPVQQPAPAPRPALAALPPLQPALPSPLPDDDEAPRPRMKINFQPATLRRPTEEGS